MTSVLRLDEVGAGDAAIAGGKAANLGALAASGFPVPPGFVVSAQAYRESFDPEDVRKELPAPLAESILQAHADLVGGRDGVFCVVRSSATAEDQAHASFAGQHGTYYYVTAANLLDMVRHCWASLWSPEAVAYRATHRVADAGLAMAVVVQEMVASEVSGVAFTANPVSGDRGELVIESSWGLGAALVDGRVTPDRYVLDREGLRVRERRVADKRFMVAAHVPAGTAARLMEVPAERRRRETLQPEQLETVASWALECERHFGAPQDVEWAFSEGRFHLLQSRPITGSPRAPIGAGVKGQYVLFKSLAENFTDPMTPLTADMWSIFIRPLGRVIGGRMYLDLKYVRLLVPFDLSDEDLADTLYQLSRDPRQGPARFAFRKLPLFLLVALVKYLVAGVPFARTRDMPDDFMDHTRVLCRRIEQDPAVSPLQALRRLWLLPRFLGPIGEASMIVNWASLRFLPWMQVVKAMLRRWAPELPAETAAQLCCGMEGVKSADMGRAVSALASTSQAAPAEFAAALDRFLAVHGHRAIKEFELRTPRWDEDPGPVLGMVRSAALRADGRVAADVGRVRAAAEEEVRHALRRQPLERRLGVRGHLLRLAARRARYYFKLRENSRFHHVMGFGVVRKKVLRVEKELLADGRLRCKDDVFFLHFDEMAALQAGRLGWLDVEDRIRERRLDHVRLSKTMPPKTIGIPLTRRPPADSPDDGLAGQTASPGRYEGVARVILDPSTDDSLRPGEVLVAPYTDPAWTPLFLIAGAAVVEVGSYLSHAGTVAREYGMPCVVDVPDCTRRIQTGMRIEVDADHGRVRILGQGAAA